MESVNKDIILVLNKIDAADDIDQLVTYVKEHTGDAYPIIPISSRSGANIDQLRFAILDILEKKQKDIQLAKEIEGKKAKSSIANRWIIGASTAAAGLEQRPFPVPTLFLLHRFKSGSC
ncbi:GTP-binding protein [Bacillus sp. JCM 19046]|nr:GTP-binding protein [Bacillus sp. JCM 19046]